MKILHTPAVQGTRQLAFSQGEAATPDAQNGSHAEPLTTILSQYQQPHHDVSLNRRIDEDAFSLSGALTSMGDGPVEAVIDPNRVIGSIENELATAWYVPNNPYWKTIRPLYQPDPSKPPLLDIDMFGLPWEEFNEIMCGVGNYQTIEDFMASQTTHGLDHLTNRYAYLHKLFSSPDELPDSFTQWERDLVHKERDLVLEALDRTFIEMSGLYAFRRKQMGSYTASGTVPESVSIRHSEAGELFGKSFIAAYKKGGGTITSYTKSAFDVLNKEYGTKMRYRSDTMPGQDPEEPTDPLAPPPAFKPPVSKHTGKSQSALEELHREVSKEFIAAFRDNRGFLADLAAELFEPPEEELLSDEVLAALEASCKPTTYSLNDPL